MRLWCLIREHQTYVGMPDIAHSTVQQNSETVRRTMEDSGLMTQ